MQYTQRKLQRSVTEMRRSCIERPSVSRSVPPAKAGAGVRPELIGMTFITMVLLLKNHSRQGYSRGMESMKKRVAVIMQRRAVQNRWMDGGEQVDSVAMPAAVFAWVGEFVEKNYHPEPRKRIKPQSFLSPKDRARS